MMSVPLHREEHEGGCPIKMAVRGPCQRPSSPPHDTVTDDGEVIALVFPDVKDDLRESARQRDPGDFLAPPLFHRMEPGPQRAGPTHRLRGGEDQHPAEQAIAFLTDVSRADAAGASADAWGQADVTGDLLGAREAGDVAQLEVDRLKTGQAYMLDLFRATRPFCWLVKVTCSARPMAMAGFGPCRSSLIAFRLRMSTRFARSRRGMRCSPNRRT